MLLVVAAILAVAAIVFVAGWYGSGPLDEDRAFIVPEGAALSQVAQQLEHEGVIGDARLFLLRAKLFGGDDPVRAGEFELIAGMSPAAVLAKLQSNDVILRFVTVPEGMPSIMVHERLMAQSLLTGTVPVPEEGSVLPDSYDFKRGEARAAVLGRMQRAMTEFLAAEWAKRGKDIAVDTPQEAITLASIVEKETGVPEERRMVAGLYSNRLKLGMRLQADPTIIYPITQGKPLGRRIRRSEIEAVNGYNTYTMTGLPEGPITNAGRESIHAVLHPERTDALYMVADGSGGHAFADSLQDHTINVRKWFAVRRERGEL